MWYDEDFYNEPSEFEEKIDELKESIAKDVKKDFIEEMESLKKENQNLRGIKEHFEQIKRDYENKKQELDRAIRDAETKAKRMKAEEIMEKYKTFLWRPFYTYLYEDKCDKCDENRRIEVVLPSGKKVMDDCDCGNTKRRVCVPERMMRCEIADRDGKIVAWYECCGKEGGRYYRVDYAASIYADKAMVEPGTSFDELANKENYRDILFRTKEECLAYCEYLNEINEIPCGVIYKCNGEKYEGDEE